MALKNPPVNTDSAASLAELKPKHLNLDLHIQWVPRGLGIARFDEVMIWPATTKPLLAPGEDIDIFSANPQLTSCEMVPEFLAADSITLAKYLYLPFNPLLPPPLTDVSRLAVFTLAADAALGRFVRENPRLSDLFNVLAQCSLQSTVAMVEKIGYTLIQVDGMFAVFAHESLLPQVGSSVFQLWLQGWYCRPTARYFLGLEQVGASGC